MKKEVIVLGDIEMGAGNLTDDFISDKYLSELILELSRRKHPVDLVLNGDTLDFLKCPYFEKNKLIYPRHITKKISLSKLNLIYQAHEKVFQALKRFVGKSENKLFFIFGNHDFDLIYKPVQTKIRKLLNSKKNVYFHLTYRYDGVYAEHGQQYDFLNKINFKKLFLTYEKKSILNLPFVSFGLISRFMTLKEKYPFMERISPRINLFTFHKAINKEVTFKTINYVIKSLIYYPFRHYSDPTYFFPKTFLGEAYRRWKNITWDVEEIIPVFKRKKKRSLKKNKIYILGHIHEKVVEDKDGIVIIHPGSWRDEYDLNIENRTLTPRPKRYVQIIISGDNTNYKLVEVPIKRATLNLDKVIENEFGFIKKVAKEEGFKSRLI